MNTQNVFINKVSGVFLLGKKFLKIFSLWINSEISQEIKFLFRFNNWEASKKRLPDLGLGVTFYKNVTLML